MNPQKLFYCHITDTTGVLWRGKLPYDSYQVVDGAVIRVRLDSLPRRVRAAWHKAEVDQEYLWEALKKGSANTQMDLHPRTLRLESIQDTEIVFTVQPTN